jgi:hypothetical protein
MSRWHEARATWLRLLIHNIRIQQTPVVCHKYIQSCPLKVLLWTGNVAQWERDDSVHKALISIPSTTTPQKICN